MSTYQVEGVYIEVWCLESDPKHRDRQDATQTICAKHRFRLIELGDTDLDRLDDVVPRMLLKCAIDCA